MDGKISYDVGFERLCKNYINLKLPSFFPDTRRLSEWRARERSPYFN